MHIKNKLRFIITLIIILGIGITFSTKYILYDSSVSTESNYMSNNMGHSDLTRGKVDQSPTVFDIAGVGNDSETHVDSGTGDLTMDQALVDAPVRLLEEETADAYMESTLSFSNIDQEKEQYLIKLHELKKQIDKIWEKETDSTTYAMKNTADYELTTWDKELNIIYQMLKEKLSKDEFEELRQEELRWIKVRDILASEGAAEYQGGTMEGLEYTRIRAEETQKRTYELVEYYFKTP